MATKRVQIMRGVMRESQLVMGKQRVQRENNRKNKKGGKRKEVLDPWRHQLDKCGKP